MNQSIDTTCKYCNPLDTKIRTVFLIPKFTLSIIYPTEQEL